nr:unnamed protein product [Callosobruchus analis]
MGVPQSKSPIERRNTMVRRSQRKSIYTVRAKLDRIYLDIRKFRGIEEDEEYELILEQLDRLRYELSRKVKELQPQVRNFYQITMRRIDEAEEALEDQLEDNREFHKGLKDRRGKLKQSPASRARRSRSRTLDDSEDDDDDDDNGNKEEERNDGKVERESEEEKEKRKAKIPSLTGFKRRFFKKKGDSDDEKAQNTTNGKDTDSDNEDTRKESFISQSSPELNKPVEMKLVKILTPSTSEIDIHASSGSPEQLRSPEEKRKSILKVGIPVMPENMVNEITKKSQRLSVHYKEEKEREAENALASKVNKIIKQLETTEYDIAGFVGKKNGKRYNRIKDKLKATLAELNQYRTNEETTKENIDRAKTYVGSCLAFLDEKAAENQEESDNDVFLAGNGSNAGSRQMSPVMSPTQDFFRYSKTTAI